MSHGDETHTEHTDPVTDGPGEGQSGGVQARGTEAPDRDASESSERASLKASEDPVGMTKKERDALFRQIYDREFNYVWHSLRRFGVWDRDLEDAAHDCFVVIHRKLHEFDQERPLKPWLVGIAFRVASDFRRRAQHRRELVSDEVEAVDPTQSAEHLVAAQQRRDLVREALESLDEDTRAVFVLHEIEGHTMPEVAEVLETPLNTCYSRLRLARERFTAAVKRLQAQRDSRVARAGGGT
jgi:RNA polymerase sigma-70 factor (ECF subfamily)